MSALDTLPSDQRAVLELVLRRGRGYDEIARLLSIDRAGVRERALAAFDALGPETGVSPLRRALITDYLLGQLPDRVTEDVRARLAASAGDRAWARVVASELAPVAASALPEIPVDDWAEAEPEGHEPAELDEAQHEAPSAAITVPPAVEEEEEEEGSPWRTLVAERPEAPAQKPPAAKRSSRVGGALLIAGVLLAIVVAAVLVIVLNGGSSKHAASGSKARSTATTGKAPNVIGRVTLSPSQSGSKASGLAEAFAQGGHNYLVIAAANLAANNHNAYAVWLTGGPAGAVFRLGFVSPGVGSSGQLRALTPLPANASSYKQLVISLETASRPTAPSAAILSGPFSLS